MVKEFERNAIASAAILVDAQEHFVSKTLLSTRVSDLSPPASVCTAPACTVPGFRAGGSNLTVLPPNAAASARYDILYSLPAQARKYDDAAALNELLLLPGNTVVSA